MGGAPAESFPVLGLISYCQGSHVQCGWGAGHCHLARALTLVSYTAPGLWRWSHLQIVPSVKQLKPRVLHWWIGDSSMRLRGRGDSQGHFFYQQEGSRMCASSCGLGPVLVRHLQLHAYILGTVWPRPSELEFLPSKK